MSTSQERMLPLSLITVRTNLTPFLPIGGGNRLIDSFSRIYSTTYDEADGKLGPSLSQHCHVTELCRHFRFSPDTKDTARIASLFHPKRSKYDQNKQYVCSDFMCRQKKQSDWSDCSACEKVFEKYFHFRETKVPYLKSSLWAVSLCLVQPDKLWCLLGQSVAREEKAFRLLSCSLPQFLPFLLPSPFHSINSAASHLFSVVVDHCILRKKEKEERANENAESPDFGFGNEFGLFRPSPSLH